MSIADQIRAMKRGPGVYVGLDAAIDRAAEIAAACEAELHAEVERLTRERVLLQEARDEAVRLWTAQESEAASLRAMLNEARKGLTDALSDMENGYEAAVVTGLQGTLAKIGG